MAPPMEDDDARHRREEQERRAKRKAARESKSDSKTEKERKRREHAQRVLKEQNKQKRAKTTGTPSKSAESSAFESLFTQRAQGFRIDFAFRNAPPRPPVGPCFAGSGLEGELHDEWTRYKPLNAVEVNYTWKLHSEQDLGVPLAPSAMDLSCYQDPTQKKTKKQNPLLVERDDGEGGEEGPPPMHPGDEALLNWKGPMGDTAAEQLKLSRDRARAAARLAVEGKKGSTPVSKEAMLQRTTKSSKKGFSRVLNENMQSWMKKTTYLSNDYSRKVHAFTSLAQTKEKTAQDLETKQLAMAKSRSATAISKTFEECLPPATGIRQHPTKRHLKPVVDMPLLPDVSQWGHAYTHVVLDNPPKEVGSTEDNKDLMSRLGMAFVTDVEKRQANARMTCQLLVPPAADSATQEEEKEDEPTLYRPVQQYDLEVIPLKDEDVPHVNFVLRINPSDGSATYLPISSRVQLSTGRPAPRHAGGNLISRRSMSSSDIQGVEMRTAEVDDDLAQKYDGAPPPRQAEKEDTPTEDTPMEDAEEEEAKGMDTFGNTAKTIVAEG